MNPDCGSERSILYCFSGANGIRPNKITPLWSLMAGKINTVWIYLMTIKSKLLQEFPCELVYPLPSTVPKKVGPQSPWLRLWNKYEIQINLTKAHNCYSSGTISCGCTRKIKFKDNKRVINCGYQTASSKVYGRTPPADVIFSHYLAPVSINGMEFILKWRFSCRTWVRRSMHSFISFKLCSFGKERFDHQSNPATNTHTVCAEGETACRSSLLSVLHPANRTSDDDYQGHDLCDPFLHICWLGGRRRARSVCWSCSGCVLLITGQCHFWMLSKGLDWGTDCKIRPSPLLIEPANKSEACEQVVPLTSWTGRLILRTCTQVPTAMNSVYLLQQQWIVRICSHDSHQASELI